MSDRADSEVESSTARSGSPTTESAGAPIVESYDADDGVVFYDADNPLAWIEADNVLPIDDQR